MMVKPDLLWHSISTNILSIYSKCTIEANYTTVKFKMKVCHLLSNDLSDYSDCLLPQNSSNVHGNLIWKLILILIKVRTWYIKDSTGTQLVQANCLKLIKPPITYIAVPLKLGYSLIQISETKTYTKHNWDTSAYTDAQMVHVASSMSSTSSRWAHHSGSSPFIKDRHTHHNVLKS